MAGIFGVTFQLVCTGDETYITDTLSVAAETATEAIAKATKYYKESEITEDDNGNKLPTPTPAYSSVELHEVKAVAKADI